VGFQSGRRLAIGSHSVESGSVKLSAKPSAGGDEDVLFESPEIANGHQYDVAPNGRFLINVDSESDAVPITLLLNWKP
jgi:hypothetical protein